MIRKVLFVSMLTACLFVGAASGRAAAAEYIYFEAEDGNIVAPMQVGDDSEASGGRCIFVPVGTGESVTPGPEAVYTADLAEGGSYHLWLCIHGPAPDQDALYVGLDGNYDRVYPSQTFKYEWVKAEVTHGSKNYIHNLSAGRHRINIGHGEEMARADRILLTDDLAFVPSITPPETVPPNFYGISARPGITTAAIKWNTDEVATAQVEFRKVGTTVFQSSEVDNDLKINAHVIVIQGLEPDTDYEYRAVSRDKYDNEGVSAPLNVLTTLPAYPLLDLPAGELTLVGDPAFSRDSLSPEMRLWYDRVVESMSSPGDYIEYNATSSNSYRYRAVNEYVSAMLAALRATGDLKFLDEVVRISEFTRAALKDARVAPDPAMKGADLCDGSRDGYLNWLFLDVYPKSGYSTSSSYFGKDNMPLEEDMAHGWVAAAAYALHVNRHLNPEYGKKADFWVDYLENHFLAKWAARAGGDSRAWLPESQGGVAKRLTHPLSNLVRVAYYLYKITGKPFYLEQADHYGSMLASHVQVNPLAPTAFAWKHEVWGSDAGYQRINYAQYFMIMVQEMALEKFGGYYPDADMQQYAGTFRDVVFAAGEPDWNNMTYRVNGEGSTGFNFYNLSGFARWDPTGYIYNLAEQKYTPGQFYQAAYALQSLSERTFTPALDLTPPSSGGHHPAKGAVDVPVDATVSLHLLDSGSGVDGKSIVMTVGGERVTPALGGTPANCTVSYAPAAVFPYSHEVVVSVEAADLAGNAMSREVYSFTTASRCGGDFNTYYRDADGDGYGNPAESALACLVPEGYVANAADCDDSDRLTHPGAAELCDALDNDCDGLTDEGVTVLYYRDVDGDGYGDNLVMEESCSPPDSYVSDNTDCDDFNSQVNPGETESSDFDCSDRRDNDCDGLVDSADPDCPSPSVPGQDKEKVCYDGVDNDGDGLVDCQDPDCGRSRWCRPRGGGR